MENTDSSTEDRYNSIDFGDEESDSDNYTESDSDDEIYEFSSFDRQDFNDSRNYGTQHRKIDRNYGNNKNTAPAHTFFWYLATRLNKLIIKDRIFRNKKDAVLVATNQLRNYSSSDAKKLIRILERLDLKSTDDVQLQQGNYAVEINRVILYN